MADRKRCCCNCGNDIRVKDKNGFVTHCECAIDGHHIGYIETFEGWCRRWKKDHTFDGMEENNAYEAIAKAISDDDAYYEDKALEMGVSLETAKRIDQQERDHARQQKQEAMNLEQQRLQNHFLKLEQQGEALKKVFPNFDLRTELQNPKFAQMTSPNSLMSLEDAYYAVHRKEIEAARSQVIAQKTAEKFSNAIQAGSRRPDENGTSGQAPSVTTFDYSKASKEQRESLKREIYAARARGEKLYPGR